MDRNDWVSSYNQEDSIVFPLDFLKNGGSLENADFVVLDEVNKFSGLYGRILMPIAPKEKLQASQDNKTEPKLKK